MNDNEQSKDSEAPPAQLNRLRVADALIATFRPFGGVDLDTARDRTPVTPISFD